MKTVSTIVFDLDGTLIDSSPGVVAAANHALKAVGLPERRVDEITPWIGYPLQQMFASFTDHDYGELHAHFQTKARETIVAGTTVLPGANEALERLVACGKTLGIASTKIRLHIDGIVAKFDWGRWLAGVAGGDEVENVKPAPDIFKLIVDRIGSDPAETLVVGDTVNDIDAARAAGLAVVAVLSPYGGEERIRQAGPDAILQGVDELPGHVGCD